VPARLVQEERYNVFAHRPELASGQPRLIFNTHLDTVPPYYPAEVDLQAGVIRGRGACDTKSILASQLLAAQRLVAAGHMDVGLLFVVSEETDHSGMKRANALGLRPDFLVVGEPTESLMIRSQKGILKVKLTAHGVSCHSGYPHLGKSAVDPLIDVLHEIKGADWPKSADLGDTTLNIGIIKGGHAANALASHAEALLMFRVISPPERILERVKEIAGDRLDVDVITANSPVALSTVPGYEEGVVAFNTDIAYFELKPEATAYLIGPGSILDAHSDHEKIMIPELKKAIDVYFDMAVKLLSR
jgi:acetylornithine deacetylase